jgi:glucokinase
MTILALDLGGTKLAAALFSISGELLSRESIPLNGRKGSEVGQLIGSVVSKRMAGQHRPQSIGVSVPGLYRSEEGSVWAPNIPGWDDYPLLQELRAVSGTSPVAIDSDRACCILGERWQGNAKGCKDAIYLSVGTGIGAGILVNGTILRGSHDIAGAIGWMALQKPYQTKYTPCGCFEYYASGEGIARLAREVLSAEPAYTGELKLIPLEKITAHQVFESYEAGDQVAAVVIRECVEFWGMAVANMISIFNPEKIIFGGGVFGPAVKLIPQITEQAARWAQPISATQATIEESKLSGNAAIFGAGFLALTQIDRS